MDLAQSLLPRFRSAIEKALERYGPERVQRSVPAWQGMSRLLIGTELLSIARTLPPSLFPDLWGAGCESLQAELDVVRSLEESQVEDASTIWALELQGSEGPNGWLEVYFQASTGDDFRGYIPKVERVVSAVRYDERPESFLDSYQWADFGLPQLFRRRIVLADRFQEDGFLEALRCDLEDYRSASLT